MDPEMIREPVDESVRCGFVIVGDAQPDVQYVATGTAVSRDPINAAYPGRGLSA